MAQFYNVSPSFQDATGTPYVGGKLYFGDPDVDPKNNPKTVYLDEAGTVPADNPQTLDSFGSPAQGTIWLKQGAEYYSVLLEDANGNQIFNRPRVIGINAPQDLTQLPAATFVDSLGVKSDTDADLKIDSGVATGSEGTLTYLENAVQQWQWVRKAIIDGGAMVLRRVAGTGAPDEPIEFPYVGGWVLKWLGTKRLAATATGVEVTGELENNKQVLVASGTFQHDGTPVGTTFHITSVSNTGLGEYTVVLDFFPDSESDLIAETNAVLTGITQVSRGEAGGQGSGTVKVLVSNTDTGASENASIITVTVFDQGRGD